jgi:hypothetical protein
MAIFGFHLKLRTLGLRVTWSQQIHNFHLNMSLARKNYWDNRTSFGETKKQPREAPNTEPPQHPKWRNSYLRKVSWIKHLSAAICTMEQIVFVWLHYIPSPTQLPSRWELPLARHSMTHIFPQKKIIG